METHQQLQIARYFDFQAHPFDHQDLFEETGTDSVVAVLDRIGPYSRRWLSAIPPQALEMPGTTESDIWPQTRCEGEFDVLCEEDGIFQPDRIIGGREGEFIYIAAGARVHGGTIDLRHGSIFIGAGALIQGAWICGPAIIGAGAELRPGAYLRSDVIIGRKSIIRGELKNTVVMDEADFPHPCYLGDSLCGFSSHFGNQATAANVNIFGRRDAITLKIGDQRLELGRRKIGIIMGDYCQVGCNAVSDPGTFLLPHTIVYSLTRINSGVYGPNEVVKNKPMEHGIIERSPLLKK